MRLLEEAGFEVAGQAGDADDLLRKVRAHRPDIAIVDVRMPPTTPTRASRPRRRSAGAAGVGMLLLSQHAEDRYLMRLLADGAEGVGYLLKDRVVELDRFVDAVRRVADGGSALDPEVVALMVGRRRGDPLDDLDPPRARGARPDRRGPHQPRDPGELFVTERAVERHVTSIFRKLDLPATGQEHRRVLAVLAYLRE